MSKVRINDLARELEVKSKAILDVLDEVGVTEKKTHSSSIEEHEAEKVRAHFRAAAGESQTASKASRPSRPDEIKTKIDLSNISRPGDVLNAIRKQQAPPVPAPPVPRPVVVPPQPVESKPAVAPTPIKPIAPPVAPVAPAPRVVAPAPAAVATVITPPAAPVALAASVPA